MTGPPIDANNTKVPMITEEENYITARAKVSKIYESGDDMEIDNEE